MKIKILILLSLILNISLGQQYDGLHIKNRKVDKNNETYKLGNEFVFGVHITINDTSFSLKKTNLILLNSPRILSLGSAIFALTLYFLYAKIKRCCDAYLFQLTTLNQKEDEMYRVSE